MNNNIETIESKFSNSLSNIENSLSNIKKNNLYINNELNQQNIIIEDLNTKTNETQTNVKSVVNKTKHVSKWYKTCNIQ